MSIIYDIIFLLFAIACLPYLALKGKLHEGLWSRFGFSLRRDVTGKKLSGSTRSALGKCWSFWI